MYGIDNYWGFVVAGIVLNITPGADTMYILARSISQGRRAGVYSVLGISSGAVVHTTFAAVGLSMLLQQSALAFDVVRYLGVAYLAYLGIGMIVRKGALFDSSNQRMERADLWKIYRQAVVTNVLNPKVALFFMSLMPQFIDPQCVNGAVPFIILGLTLMTTGTIWCLVLVYSAAHISVMLRDNQRIGFVLQKLCGGVFILLGIRLLFW